MGRIHLRPGGGGAGGILVKNEGPTAGEGEGPGGASGGVGYGAGGGSGFTSTDENDDSDEIHYAGGKGASGLVIIDWSDTDRHSPLTPLNDYCKTWLFVQLLFTVLFT